MPRGGGGKGEEIETVGAGYVVRGHAARPLETAWALLRLGKPGIVAAVLLAGFTGMVLAQRGWPDGGTGIACLSALLLSAAGSALLNGVLDSSLDRRMARLEKRVAAMERAGKRRTVLIALAAISMALLITFCYLNMTVFLLVLAAVFSYTILYTLGFKRRSPWGAVPGGLPGALPVLIGYAAVSGTVGLDAVILFVFMLLWQPPHFWTLAMGCSDDYRKAGIPVLPLARGYRYTMGLIFTYAAALIPASLSLVLFGFCSPWYGAAALACGIAFMAVCWLFMVREKRSGVAFSASIIYLLTIFAAIVVDICFIQGRL